MNSINIVDIIIIAVVLIAAISGFKKGFIKQVGRIIAVVASVVLAIMFYKTVAGYVAGFKFIADLEPKMLTWISDKGEIFSKSLADVGEEGLRTALTTLKLPEALHAYLLKGIDMSNLPDKSIAEFMAPLLFKYICYAIGFLLVYIAVWIVAIIIVRAVTKVVEHVPGVSFLNRLLGLAVGAAKVLIFFWSALYAVSFLSALPSVGDKINDLVNQYILTGTISKYLYDNNLIIYAITLLANHGEAAEGAETALRLLLNK